jgi:hypothetical protein
MTTVMNYVPELIEDHVELCGVVATLADIAARQQLQIAALSARLDEIYTARVVTELHGNANEMIMKLAESGSSLGKHSVTLKFESRTLSDGSAKVSRREHSLVESSRHASAGLSLALQKLRALNFSVGLRSIAREEVTAKIEEAWSTREEAIHQGQADFCWENLGSPNRTR